MGPPPLKRWSVHDDPCVMPHDEAFESRQRSWPTTDELRDRRAALVAQRSRVRHWQRLLRARIDLAVAAAGVIDGLAALPGTAPDGRPWPAVPDVATLTGLIGPGAVSLSDLEGLDECSRQLQHYAEAVDCATELATGQLVDRYAGDPRSCLRRTG